MSKSKVMSGQIKVIVLRCVIVPDSSYDSETLIPCQASAPSLVNAEQRADLLEYMGWKRTCSQEYLLIEPMDGEQISALIEKGERKAAEEALAAQRRLAAEERRRKAAELARKKKRLEKLEALAKGGNPE